MHLLFTNSKIEKKVNTNNEKQSFLDCFLHLRNNIFLYVGIIIAIACFFYGIFGVFGFSAYPDEFGYWAPAAAILGYDWSEITSLGSYYSYGYSILLVPFLAFFSSSINAYRAATLLNLILQCVAFPLLFFVMDELFPGNSSSAKKTRAIIISVSILYPAWIFYVQTTMTEALLNFLMVLSVFLMMKFLNNPKAVTGIVLGIVLVYMYFVHMRCVGTIIAGFLTLLAWAIRKREKSVNKKNLIVLSVIIVLFVFSFLIKDRIISLLYSGTGEDVLSWNDYSGIMFRITKILSLQGIKNLLMDICGKLLYIGLATFGIGYFGFYSLFRHFLVFCRKYRDKSAESRNFLWLYIFLMAFMQFMVALVYLNGASDVENNRLDIFLHGRYLDIILPLLFAVGLHEMLITKKYFRIGVISLVIIAICDVVAFYVISINKYHMYNAHGFTMIGMSYFVQKPLEDAVGYLMKETILRVSLMVAVLVVVFAYRKMRQKVFLFLIFATQVVLGLSACDHFIFQNQSYIYGDVLLGEKLEELRAEYPDREIVSIYESEAPYIEIVQFEDKKAKIHVLDGEKNDIDINQYLSKDTMIIVEYESGYVDTLKAFYNDWWTIGHLTIYYEDGEL